MSEVDPSYWAPFGWTPNDMRAARKMLRRVALGQFPLTEQHWNRDVRVAQLAIALALVRFFNGVARGA